MSPVRHGMDVVRSLDAGERALLDAAYAECRGSMPSGLRAIHWVNLYLNRAFSLEHPSRARLHEWVTGTVAEAYADWPEVHLLSYSFVVNPARSPDGQPFHCDYARTTSNLFVPLTPVTPNNATQFIRRPIVRAPVNANTEFGSLEELMAAEGLTALEVSQVVCAPYSLLRLNPDTPHRGIPNGEDYDRVMFCVTVDERDRVVPETTHFKYSTKEYESAAR